MSVRYSKSRSAQVQKNPARKTDFRMTVREQRIEAASPTD
jgi:hypothetical protein